MMPAGPALSSSRSNALEGWREVDFWPGTAAVCVLTLGKHRRRHLLLGPRQAESWDCYSWDNWCTRNTEGSISLPGISLVPCPVTVAVVQVRN